MLTYFLVTLCTILRWRLLLPDLGVDLHRAIICSICLFAFMLLFSLSAQITAWLTLTMMSVKRSPQMSNCLVRLLHAPLKLLLQPAMHVYG